MEPFKCEKIEATPTEAGIETGVQHFSTYLILEIDETNATVERLYKGFILYVLILIDIFLVIGLLFGNKLQKQQESISPNDGTVQVYTGVNQENEDVTQV